MRTDRFHSVTFISDKLLVVTALPLKFSVVNTVELDNTYMVLVVDLPLALGALPARCTNIARSTLVLVCAQLDRFCHAQDYLFHLQTFIVAVPNVQNTQGFVIRVILCVHWHLVGFDGKGSLVESQPVLPFHIAAAMEFIVANHGVLTSSWGNSNPSI